MQHITIFVVQVVTTKPIPENSKKSICSQLEDVILDTPPDVAAEFMEGEPPYDDLDVKVAPGRSEKIGE